MSGGSFYHAYGTVYQFADDLRVKLDEFDKADEFGDKRYKFEPETMSKLREIERLARYTARLMKEAEWLYSGDTSDASFMKRVGEIELSAWPVWGKHNASNSPAPKAARSDA